MSTGGQTFFRMQPRARLFLGNCDFVWNNRVSSRNCTIFDISDPTGNLRYGTYTSINGDCHFENSNSATTNFLVIHAPLSGTTYSLEVNLKGILDSDNTTLVTNNATSANQWASGPKSNIDLQLTVDRPSTFRVGTLGLNKNLKAHLVLYGFQSAATEVRPTGSPFIYQNLDGIPNQGVQVISGALSDISWSSNNLNWYSTGQTRGIFHIDPDMYLRITYSGSPAPTITKNVG
jgi:hypothetical protein